MVDTKALQSEATGRAPLLEGQPVSVAKAHHLACEAEIIPAVFDYETGAHSRATTVSKDAPRLAIMPAEAPCSTAPHRDQPYTGPALAPTIGKPRPHP